ncbi:MAG: ankyrin repeat domain-containing protein [Sphingobacteriia bacterium]|nr:ankyrin repeat domain-containing protein [Sphingobacteriia bacterium]
MLSVTNQNFKKDYYIPNEILNLFDNENLNLKERVVLRKYFKNEPQAASFLVFKWLKDDSIHLGEVEGDFSIKSNYPARLSAFHFVSSLMLESDKMNEMVTTYDGKVHYDMDKSIINTAELFLSSEKYFYNLNKSDFSYNELFYKYPKLLLEIRNLANSRFVKNLSETEREKLSTFFENEDKELIHLIIFISLRYYTVPLYGLKREGKFKFIDYNYQLEPNYDYENLSIIITRLNLVIPVIEYVENLNKQGIEIDLIKKFLILSSVQDWLNYKLLQTEINEPTIIENLLIKGANPNAYYHNLYNFFHKAFGNWSDEYMIVLPGTTSNPMSSREKRFPAREETIKTLLNYGADPNLKDIYGMTAFYRAIYVNHEEMVELMLNLDAETQYVTKDLKNPLSLSLSSENMFNKFLEKGLNIKEVFKEGTFLFLSMVENAHINNIKTLFKSGLNINGLDYEGNTPLHFAVGYCSYDLKLIECLMELGANCELENVYGASPYGLAKQMELYDVIDIMEKYMRNSEPNIFEAEKSEGYRSIVDNELYIKDVNIIKKQ